MVDDNRILAQTAVDPPAVHPPAAASLFELATPLLRRWKVLVGIPLACGIVAAAVSLVLPSRFEARTTFMAAAESGTNAGLGALAGLASQFGFTSLPSGGISPDLFSEVLTSRELLEATLQSRYPAPGAFTDSATLLVLMETEADTPSVQLARGVRALRDRVSAAVDRRTGLVILDVSLGDANLAASVANHMAELLNEFNLERMQSGSGERRRFVGGRLDAAAAELEAAEDSLLRFLQTNREYRSSPLLTFEASRLERRVQFLQSLSLTLAQEYEQARIAEVRDTPVLTIVDRAIPPDRRSSPRRKLIVLATVAASFLLVIPLVYGLEYAHHASLERRADYAAFQQELAKARQQIRSILPRR